jgi:hypothetical protein
VAPDSALWPGIAGESPSRETGNEVKQKTSSLRASHLIKGWGGILTGRAPLMSIEITRECPLSCP